MSEILAEDDQVENLTLALNYVCNSRCRFCFIERELDLKLAPTSEQEIAALFAENARLGQYQRIILSGAECTLRKDLPDIARRAHAEGGFDVVQIQTNGRRLSDRAYLMTLLAAGITEYFVSVHAGDAELDAYLTRSPRSFEQMRQGLRNIRAVGARLISNSCVTRGNYEQLPALADFLLAEGVPESHFWAFIEFGRIDQDGEHVRFPEVAPALREAVSRLKAKGVRVHLSWFPECLLGEHRDVVDNHRSDTHIHAEFSQRSKEHGGFSCVHQDRCPSFMRSCVGLHERYVEVFGDEAEHLHPLPPLSEGGPEAGRKVRT